MPAHFVCPGCWQTVACEPHLIGTPMRCPSCHERGVVTEDKRPPRGSEPPLHEEPVTPPPTWTWVIVGSFVATLVGILAVGLVVLLRL